MTRRGTGERLVRALCARLGTAGVEARGEVRDHRSWTSITFAGERNALRLRIDGVNAAIAADDFLAGLADAEFDLPGHWVVDIILAGEERAPDGGRVMLDLDVITVEAG